MDLVTKAVGTGSKQFWHWQERTSDALWNLALRGFPWPPQKAGDRGPLIRKMMARLFDDVPDHFQGNLALGAMRPVSYTLRGASNRLRYFIDAQLLISAQTTSPRANALYGVAALGKPGRGAVHLCKGMIEIVKILAKELPHNLLKLRGAT